MINYPVTGPLFDAGGTRYCKYIFKTNSGLEYTVVFYVRRGAVVECWFEVRDEGNDKIRPQHLTTDKGELYKIMGTIANTAQDNITITCASGYGGSLAAEIMNAAGHLSQGDHLLVDVNTGKSGTTISDISPNVV